MLGLYSLERINESVCTFSLAELLERLVKTPKNRPTISLLCRGWYYGCRSEEAAAYRYTLVHNFESSYEEFLSELGARLLMLVLIFTRIIKSYLKGFPKVTFR